MTDFALFHIKDRPVFSLTKAYQRLILISFALFLILGQFLRLIPLPYFPSHFSLAEALLYLTTFPLYFCVLRKSMWLLLGIALSILYGSLLHGFDLTSILYGGKLIAMIVSGIVVGDLLCKRFSLEEGIDFFLKIFFCILVFGAIIFFVFPQAHHFFAFLDQYGVHFTGDPHKRRFISPFFDPNYYATIACIPLILTWVRKKNILFFLFLASILLTFSRSGIATCLALLLLQMRRLPILLLLGVTLSCFYFNDWMVFIERIAHFTTDPSALARAETFQTALQFFWKHPFFGIGYHYLAPLFFLEFGRLAPDSSLLITLIDFGLIPTLLFALYGIYWSIRQFHKKQQTVFSWLYIYLLLCILFTSHFNNLLYYQYWLVPMIALFTFLNRSLGENRARS
jgi:hypothetical protein